MVHVTRLRCLSAVPCLASWCHDLWLCTPLKTMHVAVSVRERQPEWAFASACYYKSSMCDCRLFERVYIVLWFMLIEAALCLEDSQIHLALSSAYMCCVCMCAQSICECVRVILGVSRRGSVSPTQSAESLYIRTIVSTINSPRYLGTGSTVELQMNSSFAWKAY